MASAVPHFSEARSTPAKRESRPASLTQMLGAAGFIAGVVGGSAAGLEVFSGQGQIETTFLWALLAASSTITFLLGSVEARILGELRKPFER